MFDFACPDAKGQGSESTMRRSMAVAANDCSAGQSETLLRTDDMHNALSLVSHAKVREVELLNIVFESDALRARVGFLDEAGDIFEVVAGCCRDILKSYECCACIGMPAALT